MMRLRKTKQTGLSPIINNNGSSAAGNNNVGGEPANLEWEMRPGGMLVQKRMDSDQNSSPAPIIRIRVKHGSIYHEISINSQASFGELKKKLTEVTGLHHEDQKILYKDKERDSKAYLDITGVKDKSKLVVMEDPISQEKRVLEMRKNAKLEKAAKSVSKISLDVDRLAGQVSAYESVISRGGKVGEKELVNVTELLMNELIKLDAIIISTDGDVKIQRRIQVRRVQKLVETLDVLKVKNAAATTSNNNGSSAAAAANSSGEDQQQQQKKKSSSSGSGTSSASKPPVVPVSKRQNKSSIGHSPLRPTQAPQESRRTSSSGTVVTTQWELFDSTNNINHEETMGSPPPLIPLSPSSSPPPQHSTGAGASSIGQNNNNGHPQKFNWDLWQ